MKEKNTNVVFYKHKLLRVVQSDMPDSVLGASSSQTTELQFLQSEKVIWISK